jgi:hypothetical protein
VRSKQPLKISERYFKKGLLLLLCGASNPKGLLRWSNRSNEGILTKRVKFDTFKYKRMFKKTI